MKVHLIRHILISFDSINPLVIFSSCFKEKVKLFVTEIFGDWRLRIEKLHWIEGEEAEIFAHKTVSLLPLLLSQKLPQSSFQELQCERTALLSNKWYEGMWLGKLLALFWFFVRSCAFQCYQFCSRIFRRVLENAHCRLVPAIKVNGKWSSDFNPR